MMANVGSANDARRFRLRAGEAVPDGVVRIACGQLDSAIERLGGETDEDIGTAVHETRKSLKRLRATVRLARDELGDEVYRRENRAFRDAGRRLAGARDSEVLLQTLDGVVDRHADQQPAERYAAFKRTLVGQHGAAIRRLREDTGVGDALGELDQARSRVPDWPLQRQELASLAPGLRRIYRRGRRAYRSARDDSSAESLHQLRKRVKDLWYAAQIVEPASPKRMKLLARRAHKLSDLIGEDRDLAMLAARVSERRDRFADETAVDEMLDLIERRRKKLQRKAMKLGKRLYRPKPRKLERALADARAAHAAPRR